MLKQVKFCNYELWRRKKYHGHFFFCVKSIPVAVKLSLAEVPKIFSKWWRNYTSMTKLPSLAVSPIQWWWYYWPSLLRVRMHANPHFNLFTPQFEQRRPLRMIMVAISWCEEWRRSKTTRMSRPDDQRHSLRGPSGAMRSQPTSINDQVSIPGRRKDLRYL